MGIGLNHPAPFFLALHLAVFAVACLVCLGRVAADRPPARQLTRFYLLLAFGGMLGAVFNGFVAPLVFTEISEYPLAMVLACFCSGRARLRQGACVLGVAYFVGASVMAHRGQDLLYRERTFFGTLKVLSKPQDKLVYLVHGSTSHGAQSTDPERKLEPLTYYSRKGPAGQIFEELRKKGAGARIGVIGLGAGTLAAYARPGETWTFFELDPGVVEIAKNPAYFTYLQSAAVPPGIVLGDARLSMRDVPDGSLSLLIVDAFSSDSVPAHLMTREAQALYLSKLAPGGFMAFHVSNRFLRLAPVVGAVASQLGAVARVRTDVHGYGPASGRPGESPSIWTAVARQDADLGGIAQDERWKPIPADTRFAWTDDFNDLIGLIRW
jgi:hypothetical protein